MANTTVVTTIRSESVSEALQERLAKFYDSFLKVHKKHLEESGVSLKSSPFGWSHDVIIAIDRTFLFVIASKDTSTEVSSTDRYFDFSKRGTIELSNLMKSAARDLGWKNMTYLMFSREILNASEELKLKEFERISREIVEDIKNTQSLTDRLGISEVLTYLEKAKEALNVKNLSGLHLCIENCRQAVSSLLSGFVPSEGLLTQSDDELVETVLEMLKRLQYLSQEITEEKALLILRLMEALTEYLVKVAKRLEIEKKNISIRNELE
ncbi:MAG: hypothetical protein N2513_10050 [Deltaproteobacteria bacterium]|nr:hypothetical protein [Deltaproteobacteria bacterium]